MKIEWVTDSKSQARITHTCGHVQFHRFKGPRRGRPADAAEAANRPCADCYNKRPIQKRSGTGYGPDWDQDSTER